MTQRFFWLLGLCAGLSVTPPPAAAETRCDPWFEPLKTATDPASESLFRRQALLCLAVEEHKSAKKEKILSYSLKNDATDPALSAVYKTESKTGRKPSDFSDRAGMQTCVVEHTTPREYFVDDKIPAQFIPDLSALRKSFIDQHFGSVTLT